MWMVVWIDEDASKGKFSIKLPFWSHVLIYKNVVVEKQTSVIWQCML